MYRVLLALMMVGLIGGDCQFASAQKRKNRHSVDETSNPKADMTFANEAAAPEQPLTLWYRKPATDWERLGDRGAASRKWSTGRDGFRWR